MTEITVAALQLAFGPDIDINIANVSRLVREAAGRGAQVVLPPELFEGEYFCRVEDEGLFATARPVGEHKAVKAMQALAAELAITIPTSFFEADGPHHYNSLAMIGADGAVQGVYRKSHIPDGPGYEEKFYFRGGDTGFKVWPTKFGRIGVGICWDQWYPEGARLMALAGAELLLYPTAIGWDPDDAQDEKDRQRGAWILSHRGHAVANGLPVLSCNRVGHEPSPLGASGITFWGSSHVLGPQGEFLAEANTEHPEILMATVDLARSEQVRRIWPFLRDRRIDAYQDLLRRYRD